MKLVDYLVMDSKLHMMVNSADSMVSLIKEMNTSYGSQKGQAKKYMFRSSSQSWVVVEGIAKGEAIEFNPSREGLRKLFDEIVTKGVSRICAKHRELI